MRTEDAEQIVIESRPQVRAENRFQSGDIVHTTWCCLSKPPMPEAERLLRAIVEASKRGGLNELLGTIHEARTFLVSKDLGR